MPKCGGTDVRVRRYVLLPSKPSRGCGGGTPPLSVECTIVSSSQANKLANQAWGCGVPPTVCSQALHRVTDCRRVCGGGSKGVRPVRGRGVNLQNLQDFHRSQRTARTPRRPHAPVGLDLVHIFWTNKPIVFFKNFYFV